MSYSKSFALLVLIGAAITSCSTKFDRESEVVDSSVVVSGPEMTAHPPQDSTASAEPKRTDSVAKPSPSEINIKLLTPREGMLVSPDGFDVKGLARTFENSVAYRLKMESGKTIDGHTTATGEMGTFSPFVFSITPGESGKATLEVFEFSAKDGSEINKVTVHVLVGNEH
jgi:hypothetical protein